MTVLGIKEIHTLPCGDVIDYFIFEIVLSNLSNVFERSINLSMMYSLSSFFIVSNISFNIASLSFCLVLSFNGK